MTRSGTRLTTRVDCAVPPPANARVQRPCSRVARYRVVNQACCAGCLTALIEEQSANFIDGTVPVTVL